VLIIGLTGSIGMGKSTAARQFKYLGVDVYEADKVVHDIIKNNKDVIRRIKIIFPDVMKNGAVDRQRLGKQVFASPNALKKLENIIHPVVRHVQKKFIMNCARRRRKIIVLDVPLLFETGQNENCDVVCVVTCPAFLQKIRVMSRPGMTEKKFQNILNQQMPDIEKRRHADMIINTGLGHGNGYRQVKSILNKIKPLA